LNHLPLERFVHLLDVHNLWVFALRLVHSDMRLDALRAERATTVSQDAEVSDLEQWVMHAVRDWKVH